VEVKNISNKEPLIKQVTLKEPESTKDPGKLDSLEISTEGKEMAKLELNNKRLLAIRTRIETKFYNSDDVLTKVADKILKELN
jgi:hypothetical protein